MTEKEQTKQAGQDFEPVTEEGLQDLEEALPMLVQDVLFRNGASVRDHLEHEVPRLIATIRDLQRQLQERDELVEAIRAEFPQLVRLLEEKQQKTEAQSGQSAEEEV